ncbi:MAG: PQQ-binding-like beta-propeller repeat protein [Planctomycetes bacterium]|nr:PQQ-binding-like beta-propeller repeat protein [Planctomycetota bacterium]
MIACVVAWTVFFLSLPGVDLPAKGVAPLRPPSVRSLAYSPDGKTLVAGVGRRTEAGILVAWDTRNNKVLWRKDGQSGFASLSFAPDGKSVAVVHGKPTVLRLDPITGEELGQIGPHPAVVRASVHIPGTDLLATGSDGVIRLWDLKTGKVAKELKGHAKQVLSLVASPDGRWLISKGEDGTRGWDVAAGSELKDAIRQEQRTEWYRVAFVAPDRILFGTSTGTRRILELPSGKELLRYPGNGEGIAYSAALGITAGRWHRPEIELMDLKLQLPTDAEKTRIETILKEFDDDSYETRVAASKAMQRVGSVAAPSLRQASEESRSAEVRMRARESLRTILEEPLRSLKGHLGQIGPMVFSPDGAVLATGADDGTVRLWDPQTGKELVTLEIPAPIAAVRP